MSEADLFLISPSLCARCGGRTYEHAAGCDTLDAAWAEAEAALQALDADHEGWNVEVAYWPGPAWADQPWQLVAGVEGRDGDTTVEATNLRHGLRALARKLREPA